MGCGMGKEVAGIVVTAAIAGATMGLERLADAKSQIEMERDSVDNRPRSRQSGADTQHSSESSSNGDSRDLHDRQPSSRRRASESRQHPQDQSMDRSCKAGITSHGLNQKKLRAIESHLASLGAGVQIDQQGEYSTQKARNVASGRRSSSSQELPIGNQVRILKCSRIGRIVDRTTPHPGAEYVIQLDNGSHESIVCHRDGIAPFKVHECEPLGGTGAGIEHIKSMPAPVRVPASDLAKLERRHSTGSSLSLSSESAGELTRMSAHQRVKRLVQSELESRGRSHDTGVYNRLPSL